MNNVIMRKIVLTSECQPLSSKKSEVASVDISSPPSNAGAVFFQGDDGSDIPWIAGEFHSFKSVDLSAIRVKGTPGDIVTIIGGTW